MSSHDNYLHETRTERARRYEARSQRFNSFNNEVADSNEEGVGTPTPLPSENRLALDAIEIGNRQRPQPLTEVYLPGGFNSTSLPIVTETHAAASTTPARPNTAYHEPNIDNASNNSRYSVRDATTRDVESAHSSDLHPTQSDTVPIGLIERMEAIV